MKIDHIGYAVKNMDKARKSLESIGYVFDEVVKDIDRNIYIAFGEMDGYRIELVSPISTGSPVDMQLSRLGPTPYHICYKSTDIEADIKHLQSNRFKVSIPLAPAVAFGNKRVVLMYSPSVDLIEIVEE